MGEIEPQRLPRIPTLLALASLVASAAGFSSLSGGPYQRDALIHLCQFLLPVCAAGGTLGLLLAVHMKSRHSGVALLALLGLLANLGVAFLMVVAVAFSGLGSK